MREVRKPDPGLASGLARLREGFPDCGLALFASRRFTKAWITEGISAYGLHTEVFEPIRKRLPFGRRWRAVQSSEGALRNIECFLSERPDLRSLR